MIKRPDAIVLTLMTYKYSNFGKIYLVINYISLYLVLEKCK